MTPGAGKGARVGVGGRAGAGGGGRVGASVGVWVRVGVGVCVAIAGGYALTGLAVVLLGQLLVRAGMPASEAVVSAGMSGMVIYLGLLLWALACVNVARLCGWMALGSAVLAGLVGVLR